MNQSKKNVTATTSKLLTPCRSVGLTRKRKQVAKSPTQNENNINSFNENSSGESHDSVEEPAPKFKNLEKKQKIIHGETHNEFNSLQKSNASKKRQKKKQADILKVPAFSETCENNSLGSYDPVEDMKSKPVVKLKTSRKKAKIHEEEMSEKSSVIPETGKENNNSIVDKNLESQIEDVKKSRQVKLNSPKMAKKQHEESLEEAVVDDKNSLGSQDFVEDVKKSKHVTGSLRYRKKAKIQDEEIFEEPVVISETRNKNNVDDENSSKSQDIVINVKTSKLKSPKKRKKIFNEEILAAPVAISKAGNENNNLVDDENSTENEDFMEDVKNSGKKTKIHNEEILGESIIPETGNENNTLIDDEHFLGSPDNVEGVTKHKPVKSYSRKKKIHSKGEEPVIHGTEKKNFSESEDNVEDLNRSKHAKIDDEEIPETITVIDGEDNSGSRDNVENVKIFSQKKAEESMIPDVNNENPAEGRENMENVKLLEKYNINTENNFNENSSTSSEDSEPLSNWKTKNEQKLKENEEKALASSKDAKLNIKTTQIFVNLVRCDSLLEELKKINSSLTTSQEYLDDEVADINKTNAHLGTETIVETSKKKKSTLGVMRKSATKKQSPEKKKADFTNKSTESLKSNISASYDDDELSDFSSAVKPRSRISSIEIKISKPSPKPTKKRVSKQVASNKTPVIRKAGSDDDFVEKVPRNQTIPETEYIKKERIKIGENNSYTIVQRKNMISYIKSNDSSSIVKPDNTVENISSNIFILDHKNYLPEATTPSQAIDGIFDDFVADEDWKLNKKPTERTKEKLIDFEKKQLLERKANMIKKVKNKHDKLEKLKRISVYKQEHNLKDLQELALQIKRGLQEALVDLLCQLKDQQEKPYTMQSLLKNFSIPFELVGYNLDDDNFV